MIGAAKRAGRAAALACLLALAAPPAAGAGQHPAGDHGFRREAATIDDIQDAILHHKVTVTDIVNDYLERIKAYNGTCVDQPPGILGPISMSPHAGKVTAIMTLTLRPKARAAWGFDARKARSQTDAADDDPNMPDALETAAAIDAKFAKTNKLVGPLHGVVMAVKDQYDT
ncbi:MAG: amidase, partial [Frankiaceae bacterium]|nr:amidase [Frankiaceae bacterium]